MPSYFRPAMFVAETDFSWNNLSWYDWTNVIFDYGDWQTRSDFAGPPWYALSPPWPGIYSIYVNFNIIWSAAAISWMQANPTVLQWGWPEVSTKFAEQEEITSVWCSGGADIFRPGPTTYQSVFIWRPDDIYGLNSMDFTSSGNYDDALWWDNAYRIRAEVAIWQIGEIAPMADYYY